MARVPSYLRRRVGKDRSGAQFYVRVPTPAPLRKRFGDYVERSLGTSDHIHARDVAREKVVEIKRLFDRAKLGTITPDEVKEVRERELRRSFEQLAANMVESLDRLPQFAEEIAQDAANPIAASFEGNRLLGGRPTREHAEALLKTLGVEITDESVDTLTQEILKAQGVAVAMLQRGMSPPPMSGHRVKRQGTAMALSEAGRQWLAAKMSKGKERWSQQTKLQRENTLRLFVDFTKDAPIDAVTRADAHAFKTAIEKLHPKYGQQPGAKGKTLAQLLKAFPGQLTDRTLKRHMSAMHLLFDWCVETAGILPEGHRNPFSKMQRREKDRRAVRKLDEKNPTGWLPYHEEELRKLFARDVPHAGQGRKLEAYRLFSVEPKKHTAQTALLWIGFISLYSGLRENEICGLLTADVREADGVPFFVIEEHEEHDGHRVKNDNAVRRVPVHSHLVELGFLRYVAHVRKQKHAYLFPGLSAGGPDKKRNHYFTKAWTSYARQRGVSRKRTSFHSLRNNFTECLEQARVHASEVAQVVGHYRGFTFDTYSKTGLPLATLREIVEKATYQLESEEGERS